MLETCQMAVSKPNRKLWRLGGPDRSFEAQQKQFVGPREVPWQSCWEGFKAFKGCWKRARWQFRSPIESCGGWEGPDSSFEGQQKQFEGPREVPWQSCWEGFKALKGCWKRARWQFRSPIETSCSASEMPDSSFEAQQKQHMAPREVSRQSCWEVLQVLRRGRAAGKGQMAVSKPNRKLWRLGRAR